MKAKSKLFEYLAEAADFITSLGPQRVISVHAEHCGLTQKYRVWYWGQ